MVGVEPAAKLFLVVTPGRGTAEALQCNGSPWGAAEWLGVREVRRLVSPRRRGDIHATLPTPRRRPSGCTCGSELSAAALQVSRPPADWSGARWSRPHRQAYTNTPSFAVSRRIGLCGFDNPMRDQKTDELKRHIGHVSRAPDFILFCYQPILLK